MLRKLIRIVVRALLVLVILVVSFVSLVYIPPVQDLLISRATSYISNTTGMHVSVGRFRLRFPLTVSAADAAIVGPAGDTLARVGQLGMKVAFWPLLRGEVRVGGATVRDASVDYSDAASGMTLRASVGVLKLGGGNAVRVAEREVSLGNVTVDHADVAFTSGAATADTTAPPPWTVEVRRIDLSDVRFTMDGSLDARIGGGRLDRLVLDMARQSVNASSVELTGGDYRYIAAVPAETAAAAPDTSPPWSVGVDNMVLHDNHALYAASGATVRPGFDPDHIEVDGVELTADSVGYRGGEISAAVRALALRERSGLEIKEARGRFSMNGDRIAVDALSLRTASSDIALSADASVSLDPSAPLNADLRATVAVAEMAMLFPALVPVSRPVADKSLSVEGRVAGTLAGLDLDMLHVSMPGHADLDARGSVRSLLTADSLAADIAFSGALTDMGFARGFIADTALRRRVGFPNHIVFDGCVETTGGRYAPELHIVADSGSLQLKAQIDTRRGVWDADLAAVNFPMHSFLPGDSLGVVSLSLTGAGRGLDPASGGATAHVSAKIDRFDYRGYSYNDMRFDATLADSLVSGALSSAGDALQLDLDFSGSFTRRQYAANLAGHVRKIELQALGFSDIPLGGSAKVDASVAVVSPDSSKTIYSARMALDSMEFTQGDRVEAMGSAMINATADAVSVAATVRTGDLSLDFRSPMGLDSLSGRLDGVARLAAEQFAARRIDMEPIDARLPDFTLSAQAGPGNIVSAILSRTGFAFGRLRLEASVAAGAPLSATGRVDVLRVAGVTLDTVRFDVRRDGRALDFLLGMADRSAAAGQTASLRLRGSVVDNTATLDIARLDRRDSTGLGFGVRAALTDSAVTATLTPADPVFGYERWRVNADNHVTYAFSGALDADLLLDGPGGRRFHILPARLDGFAAARALRLDMAGIDIGNVLALLPSPPAVDGVLGADVTVGVADGRIVAAGKVSVDSLTWDDRRIADVAADVQFASDSTLWQLTRGTITVDGRQALDLRGTYSPAGAGAVVLDARITALPLDMFNALLPADIAVLAGRADGSVHMAGPLSRLDVDGDLGFTQGRLTMPLTGTSFGISDKKITIAGGLVDFNGFGIVAPGVGGRMLALDGEVDIRDLRKITADVDLAATNFRAISSTRNGGSQIFGNALLDVDITARGAVDNLLARGDISVLRGTDVTYTMDDSGSAIEDQRQDIVTFVAFADSLYAMLPPADSAVQLRVGGIDMLLNVDVADNVRATVDLSSNGDNRIELVGAGALTYTMNTLGDRRMTGRYTLSGGLVRYSVASIKQVNFDIKRGSYVEWNGQPTDPSFDINAVDDVRTTVEYEGGDKQQETFEIAFSMTGRVDAMAVAFDLAAPNASEQLRESIAQLTPEQRGQEAMQLLLTNAYTGPGIKSARVDSNNPVNAFIEKQVNKWARNNLKNVDLSFGMNSVGTDPDNQHTNYSYSVSKNLFSDRVKVTIGGSVSSDDIGTGGDVSENLVDDISLEYRVARRDNMFLRLYRHNITDPFEGEAQETGGGFLVRKNMTRLGELFKTTTGRDERRRSKAQLRELRRQTRQAEREAAAAADSAIVRQPDDNNE